jgi:hypothetical protein
MKTDLKIIIKDEEHKSLSDSFELHDDELYMAIEKASSEYLKKLLDEFKGTVEDVVIKTTTVMR